MIKRYILHIEFHRGYRPHISFKRVPQHGDRVVDGGVMGTLKRCPTCSDGLLHEPDAFASPEELTLDYTLGVYRHELGDILWTRNAEYVVESLTKNVLHLVRRDIFIKNHPELAYSKTNDKYMPITN